MNDMKLGDLWVIIVAHHGDGIIYLWYSYDIFLMLERAPAYFWVDFLCEKASDLW
jgi:hypothetical protein